MALNHRICQLGLWQMFMASCKILKYALSSLAHFLCVHFPSYRHFYGNCFIFSFFFNSPEIEIG